MAAPYEFRTLVVFVKTGWEFHRCTGLPGVGALSFVLRYAGLLSDFCVIRMLFGPE